MSAPRVSVVTPFYNTAAFLGEAIESVLAQDYPNFEYVLLDNCSTDGSGDIARGWAAKDRRIRLEKNPALLNQVQNYNQALRHIAPDSAWTKVVEADNRIAPECLTKMVAVGQGAANVGLVGAYGISERHVRYHGLPTATTVVSGREAIRLQLLGDAYLFGAPTTVLVRSDLVRARPDFFRESDRIAEDLSAFYELLKGCDFGFVHQILTFIRTDNDSIMKRLRGFDTTELDRYLLTARHGNDFLSPGEMAKAMRTVRSQYYRSMARGVLKGGRPEKYWELHRTGLGTIGETISPWRLAGGMVMETLRLVGSSRVDLQACKLEYSIVSPK